MLMLDTNKLLAGWNDMVAGSVIESRPTGSYDNYSENFLHFIVMFVRNKALIYLS